MKVEIIGRYIGIFILITITMIIIAINKTSDEDRSEISMEEVTKNSITKIISITKQKSETIQIKKDGVGAKFLVRPIKKYTPFICHYNGGAGSEGGWDEFIPAYEDWKKMNWKPKIDNVGLETVSFSLETSSDTDSSEIEYTIIYYPKK